MNTKINSRKLPLIAMMLFATASMAQNPAWQWARSATGLPQGENFYSEQVNGITQDASGNVYVTGSFNASGGLDLSGTTITSDANGNDDAFVAKYSPSGQLLWVNTYGSTWPDAGHSITIDGAGNVLVAGIISPSLTESVSIGSVSLNGTLADNRYTMFIAKLNPGNGSTIWAVRSSSNAFNYLTISGIGTDASNNVYVAGDYYGAPLSLGSASCNATSNQHFLFKLNSSGTAQFGRTITNGTNYLAAFAVDAEGNAYLAGHYNEDVTIGAITYPFLVGQGYYSMFFAKYNSSGVLQFFNSYGDGSVSNLVPTAMAVNGNDQVLIATHFYVGYPEVNAPSALTAEVTVGGNTFNSAGGTEPLLLMFTTSGTLSTFRQLIGQDNDIIRHIDTDAEGSFYLTGNIRSDNVNVGLSNDVVNIGSDDAVILKYDGVLNCQWAISGTGADKAMAISVDATGRRIYQGGSFKAGNVQFDATQLSNSGLPGSDLFIAKLADCTADEVTVSATGDLELCIGEETGLAAISGFSSYLWSNGATSQSISGDDLEGDYSVTATDAAGCTYVSETVAIIRYEAPELIITSDVNLNFCELQAPGTLTTTQPFVSYLWYIDSEPAGTGSTQSIEGSATVMVQVIDGNGCSYLSDPRTYTMLPTPTLSPISGPADVMEGEVVTYSATVTNASIFWEVDGGTILTDNTLSSIDVQWGPEGAGEVFISVSNTACGFFNAMNVSISPMVGLSDAYSADFSIRPNPANDFIVVDSHEQVLGLTIFDSMGRLVLETGAVQQAFRLDGLAPGLYTVRARFANGSSVQRLMVN